MIAAHLIVGAREEPFLPALLESLQGFAQTLIVNENSGLESTENLRAIEESRFAREGRLILDRRSFVDFATARNRCLALHRAHQAGAWAAFVDADEVHDDGARRIAANVERIPADVDFVDAYTRHYFQHFDWYRSIERRMVLFRVKPSTAWTGAVHEHLSGNVGRRLVLPYVYAHYGHVFSARRHAEKDHQYAELGAGNSVVAEDALDALDASHYFAADWKRLLPRRAAHPPAALRVIERLRGSDGERFSEAEAAIAARTRSTRAAAERFVRGLNFELRWRSRYLDPRGRRLLT